MKRWIATGIFVLYLLLLLIPLGRRSWPVPTRPLPARTGPVIPFHESRTGRRLQLPIEEYVLGVVAAEMGAGLPDQALAAQAMPSGRDLDGALFHSGGGECRRALGCSRSTDIRVTDGQVVISGRGYGYGVGLSQLGAAALAASGFTAEKIVHHYYHGVQIERRW